MVDGDVVDLEKALRVAAEHKQGRGIGVEEHTVALLHGAPRDPFPGHPYGEASDCYRGGGPAGNDDPGDTPPRRKGLVDRLGGGQDEVGIGIEAAQGNKSLHAVDRALGQ